jgi:hypothetical protein
MTQTPSTIPDLTTCRFCSLVSKANGEDPIGSAPVTNHWLVVELPQPWSAQVFQESEIQPLLALVKSLTLQGIRIRPIAIAPDRDYSQPGYRRLIYYRRPALAFAAFEPEEYLVPEAAVTELAKALLQQIAGQPNRLADFSSYRQITEPTRDLLICTHGNIDAACARFGFPIYDQLRKTYAAPHLRVWRCTHFGGHQYAPTLVDLPSGRYWGHLEADLLDALVWQQGDLAALGHCYRGWAGLGKFEQIAEREIWLREGWDWLGYAKQGKVIKLGEPLWKAGLRRMLQFLPWKRLRWWLEHSQQDANWAIVQIDYWTPEGKAGSYQARVAISGQIMTAIRSASPLELVPVNQYQVTIALANLPQ